MIPARWRDRSRLAALAVVSFVLAHDLVFLLTDGRSYGLALAQTGHGDQWTETVVLVAALAIGLATTGAARLIALSRLARRLDTSHHTVRAGRLADLGSHLIRAWLVILPMALVVFVIVENIEHVSIGLPAPGLAVLGSAQYHSVIGVFALISLVTALIDALYRWRRDVLIARIEAALARLPHRPATIARQTLPWVELRHSSITGHRITGRAPPAPLSA